MGFEVWSKFRENSKGPNTGFGDSGFWAPKQGRPEPLRSYTVVSLQYRPQNMMILIIGAAKRVPLILGRPRVLPPKWSSLIKGLPYISLLTRS